MVKQQLILEKLFSRLLRHMKEKKENRCNSRVDKERNIIQRDLSSDQNQTKVYSLC